jgi:hypothetical protein
MQPDRSSSQYDPTKDRKPKRQRPGGAAPRQRTDARKAEDNRLERLTTKPTSPFEWAKYVSVLRVIVATTRESTRLRANLVLKAIADYADDDGHCYPPQAMLKWAPDCSRETVSKLLIPLLVEAGYLRKEQQERYGDSGKYTVTHYWIAWPPPQAEFVDTEQLQGNRSEGAADPPKVHPVREKPVKVHPDREKFRAHRVNPVKVHPKTNTEDHSSETSSPPSQDHGGRPPRAVSEAPGVQDGKDIKNGRKSPVDLPAPAPGSSAKQRQGAGAGDHFATPQAPGEVSMGSPGRGDAANGGCPAEARYLLDIPPKLLSFAKPGDLERYGFIRDEQARLTEKPSWYPFDVCEVVS